MKIITATVLNKKFQSQFGKTVIECANGGKQLAAWAPGDCESDGSLFVNLVINEVGDTFVARRDSSRTQSKKVMVAVQDPAFPKDTTKTIQQEQEIQAPLYLKGETVTRQAQSIEFKSFAGNNDPARFAQAAGAYGLQLNVIMAGA